MTLKSSRGNRKLSNKNSRDKLKDYHNINKKCAINKIINKSYKLSR